MRHGISKALTYYEPDLRAGAEAGRLPDPRQPRRRAQEVRQGQGPPLLPVLEALIGAFDEIEKPALAAGFFVRRGSFGFCPLPWSGERPSRLAFRRGRGHCPAALRRTPWPARRPTRCDPPDRQCRVPQGACSAARPSRPMAACSPSCAGAIQRDLAGVDVAVWGIPFDAAVSNRPGARFGPQGVRRASAIFDGDPQYPFKADPFAAARRRRLWRLLLRLWPARARSRPAIEAQARDIIDAGAMLFSIGGDHYVTWPLLKAHAARHGPMALVHFDAHQDTWYDDDGPHRPRLLRRPRRARRADRAGALDPDRHPHPCARRLRHRDPVSARIWTTLGVAERGRARAPARRRCQDLSHLRHRLPRSGLRARHRHAGLPAACPRARR